MKTGAFGFPRDRAAHVLLLLPVGRDDGLGSSPVTTAGEPLVSLNAYRRGMPEVSRFYGITINFADHRAGALLALISLHRGQCKEETHGGHGSAQLEGPGDGAPRRT